MRTRNAYWLIAAVAVAVVTVMLAALVVMLEPNDPTVAAASIQRQVLEPKLESIVESHRRGK
jgi:hypothetical protein